MVDVHPQHRFSVLLSQGQDAAAQAWQDTVRRLLEPHGVTTLAARSGREALDLIQQWDPLESTCRHASLSIL